LRNLPSLLVVPPTAPASKSLPIPINLWPWWDSMDSIDQPRRPSSLPALDKLSIKNR
jgi:hypothetical protein